jgi:hypothetical protein
VVAARGAQANDGCEGTGQMIAFRRRRPSGLRPAIRGYRSRNATRRRGLSLPREESVDDLVARRLMLPEDAQPSFQRMMRVWQSATTSGTR